MQLSLLRDESRREKRERLDQAVDQVRDVCRRGADVGGVGDRYTCLIQGQERYLWFEKGRWFVEAFSE